MSEKLLKPPVRVTFVAGSLSRSAGGVFGAMRGCAMALDNREFRVSALGFTDLFSDSDRPSWGHIEPHFIPALGPPKLGYSPNLPHAIESTSPDIVHQHGLWQLFSRDINAWRRRTGSATIISPHGMLDSWALRNGGWKKRIAKEVYEWKNLSEASCLHALNENELNAIRAYGIRCPVAVIPNGIDLPDQPESGISVSVTRSKKTLLFIGRIHPKKGLAELLRAFKRLKEIEPSVAECWQIKIVGWDEGGHSSDLEVFAKQEGLEGSVIFAGPSYGDAKDAHFRDADAFILPSFSEGLPMAVLEAAAYRLPILMTESCNLAEFFALKAAYKISSDPNTLARELCATLTSNDLNARADAAYALVKQKFTWKEIAQDFAGVYRWLVAGGATPSCIDEV